MAKNATKTKRPKKPAPKPAGKPPAKIGRPTDYLPAHCETVIALGREGKSKAQMASALDVSRQTLENWAEAHPEFLDALTRARDLSMAWWEDRGQAGIADKMFNGNTWGFQMRNRFPADYSDRVVNELTGKNGGAIAVKQIADGMSPQQAAELYAETLRADDENL